MGLMVKDKAIAKILLEWNCQDEHLLGRYHVILTSQPYGVCKVLPKSHLGLGFYS